MKDKRLELLAMVMGFFMLTGFHSGGADRLGVKDGELAACPNSPNCVSTQAKDEKHTIAPLKYTAAREAALQKLADIVSGMPGAAIVERRPDYLRATFTSRIFKFVDDVEFYFDDASKTVHFRSASRLGYSDMGVNRMRMEEIRQRFQP